MVVSVCWGFPRSSCCLNCNLFSNVPKFIEVSLSGILLNFGGLFLKKISSFPWWTYRFFLGVCQMYFITIRIQLSFEFDWFVSGISFLGLEGVLKLWASKTLIQENVFLNNFIVSFKWTAKNGNHDKFKLSALLKDKCIQRWRWEPKR